MSDELELAELKRLMKSLLAQVDAEIARTSAWESFMIRSGLLRQVLQFALKQDASA